MKNNKRNSSNNYRFWKTLTSIRLSYKIAIFSLFMGAFWIGYPFFLDTIGSSYRLGAFSYIILASIFWGFKGGVIATVLGIVSGA